MVTTKVCCVRLVSLSIVALFVERIVLRCISYSVFGEPSLQNASAKVQLLLSIVAPSVQKYSAWVHIILFTFGLLIGGCRQGSRPIL